MRIVVSYIETGVICACLYSVNSGGFVVEIL